MSVQTLARQSTSTSAGWPSRTYLMCAPTYFDVRYAINPWMDPTVPVDRDKAMREWERLRTTHEALGHTVHLIEPVPELPDMVFAANGATVIGGTVLGARFRHPERAAEADAYLSWFTRNAYRRIRPATSTNEGEGDFTYAYRVIIAAHGFRTDLAAHQELEQTFGLPVVSVKLVDPRFYHLDTALCVIDSHTAACYPGAFDSDSMAKLAKLFPELIEATEADASVFGLNAVSDGRHVVLPGEATGLARQLIERGYEVVPVEMGELRKAGGGPKCCTLELRG